MKRLSVLLAALFLSSSPVLAAGEVLVTAAPYNAKCDGVTNDSVAFNAALSSSYGVVVKVPGGVTCIVENVQPPSVSSLIATNEYGSRLVSPSASHPVISLPYGVVDVVISGFWLDRNVAATSGGDGISAVAYNENITLKSLYIVNQYNGLSLGVTGNSFVKNTTTCDNYGDGLVIMPNTTASGGIGGGQWQLDDVYSCKNNGSGFNVTAAYTNTGSVTLGNWSNIRTFGNHGPGIGLNGKAGNGIYDLVLVNAFLGADGGAAEIVVDPYGANNNFTNINIEQAGTQPNGRGTLLPAGNTAFGIYVTEHQSTTLGAGSTFTNVNINTSASVGFYNRGYHTVLNGATIFSAGIGGNGGAIGIYHEMGSLIVGNVTANQQQYGIYVSADTLAACNMNLENNSVTPAAYTVAMTRSKICPIFY